MKTARINEIFFSYQGEGLYQGVPQVFVRFSGCNIKCLYCDTNHSEYRLYNADELIEGILLTAGKEKVHSVSITGGEPLCQSEFLTDFLPILKEQGYKIYLETNGILYKKLQSVLPYLDIISMDIKLPASTGERAFWDEHRAFLGIAYNKEVFAKVVITDETSFSDWHKAVEIVSTIDYRIPLILQPVTGTDLPRTLQKAPSIQHHKVRGLCKEARKEKIEEFKNFALKKLHRVEVRRQIHTVLGIK